MCGRETTIIKKVSYDSRDYYLGIDYLEKRHPENLHLRVCYEGDSIRNLVQCIIFDRSKRVFRFDRYLKRPKRFILFSANGKIAGVMVTMSLPEFYQRIGCEDYALIEAETIFDYHLLINHPSLVGRFEIVVFNDKQAQLVRSRFSVRKTHYWSVFAYRGRTFISDPFDIRLMNSGDFDIAKRLSKRFSESSPARSLEFQLRGLPYKNYVVSFDDATLAFVGISPFGTGAYELNYSLGLPRSSALMPRAIAAVGRLVLDLGCEFIWRARKGFVSRNRKLIRQSDFVEVIKERHLHLIG